MGPPGIMLLTSAHLPWSLLRPTWPSPCSLQKPLERTPPPPPGRSSAQSQNPREGGSIWLPAGLVSVAHAGLVPFPRCQTHDPEAPPGRDRAFPGCWPAFGPSLKSFDVLQSPGRHRRQGCHPDSHVGNPKPRELRAFPKVTQAVRTQGPSCLRLVGEHPCSPAQRASLEPRFLPRPCVGLTGGADSHPTKSGSLGWDQALCCFSISG